MHGYLMDLIYEAMERGLRTEEDAYAWVQSFYICTRQEFNQALESVILEMVFDQAPDEVHTIH